MNKNILIVLGGAVVVAVLVAMLVQLTLGGKDEKPVSTEAQVEILVASRNLRMGQELKDGDMRWQSWPESAVFSGAVRREDGQEPLEALEGRLRRDVAKDEPVLKNALLKESKGNIVAASLEPGMRAVAIEVSAETMVGGFIGPGDYVDVILTYKESIKAEDEDPRVKTMFELNLDKMATETILQNVRVLAVDQKAVRDEGEDKTKVGKTVTLALSAQDAEKITLARQMGELNLALRGVGDDMLVEKEWRTISDARLTSINDEIFTEYQKMKNDSGINPDIVRIYSGNQVLIMPAK